MVKATNPAFFGPVLALALAAGACTGVIAGPPGGSPLPSGEGGTGSGGSGVSAGRSSSGKGSAGSNGSGAESGTTGSGGGQSAGGAAPADVNRVAIHRLNNAEYDNTVSDLFGVESKAAAAFIDDEKLFGFDNIAAALGMSDARFEEYFNAADALVEQAFANDAARERILSCTPESDVDLECARAILDGFASRAFRRPATDAELRRLLEVVSAA
ncbi:MAG TPA: DUF1587 domain-containing protein, partial [Polyangiaceae bacterium]